MHFSHFIKHLIILLSRIEFSVEISCKDETDQDVDWFIVYKLPKILGGEEEEHLARGCAYASISSVAPKKWTLSSHSVETEECMLARTWYAFHSHNQSVLSHLFYNDAAPEGYGGRSANGHLKGMVVFDGEKGFWLMHSIPKFGIPQKYEYPKNALSNGQTALCVTLATDALNEICNHLLFCGLNIYARHLSAEGDALLDEAARTLFSEKPRFVTKAPFKREGFIRSSGNLTFQIFAKDNQLDIDIYSGMIAPDLKVPLVAETWRRGAGNNLEAFCDDEEFSVTDAQFIQMRAINRESLISFRSTQDHSKWAVSRDESSPFFCVGDLNRMESQAKRGGGAICLRSEPVWEAFHSLVGQASECAK